MAHQRSRAAGQGARGEEAGDRSPRPARATRRVHLMARDHARFYVSIWGDPDFRALTCAAQRMYFVLTSQPRLTYCGVLDYLPGRFAKLAADEDEGSVEHAVKLLEADSFVVVDRETSELIVRSFVRHDGLLASPNMVVRMVKDRETIISDYLRSVL